MLTGDTCDPIFRVRLNIGDTEGTLVADEIIAYYLKINSNDEKAASISTLKAILKQIAYEITQSVGDVYIDQRKLYEQVKDQLDRMIRDPSFNTGVGIFIGGTSTTEVDRVRNAPDFLGSPIKRGFYTG